MTLNRSLGVVTSATNFILRKGKYKADLLKEDKANAQEKVDRTFGAKGE